MGNPEERFSGMNSLFSGLDREKINWLSMAEKRQLVREIAQWSNEAPMILRSFTRPELREIICAEVGKERKYTGHSKDKMIVYLLKLVSNTSQQKITETSVSLLPSETQTALKRQKKQEGLLQPTNQPGRALLESMEVEPQVLLCENLSCRATLSPEDLFCKRCSCCICHQYDDNKDPSLWLTCDSDPPHEHESCGTSCHLTCGIKHEQAGILKNGRCTKSDGNFYCVSCGKVNGLMRTWRKQLLIAREARRVDVLCLRLSLSHKILEGTEKYKEPLKIVESSINTLENEVGPLDWALRKMDRHIVNRLSCCTEVHKLCTSAVEAFDSMSSNYMEQKRPTTCKISFEESSPTSVVIVLEYKDQLFEEQLGCQLWHRKSSTKDYPKEATFTALRPEKRFKLADLDPLTEYVCKISFFSNTITLGVWEAEWVTPLLRELSASMVDKGLGERKDVLEINEHPQTNSVKYNTELASKQPLSKLQILNDINNNKNDDTPLQPPVKEYSLSSPTSNPPSTPCKSDGVTNMPCLGGKKQLQQSDYEYCVKVIRRLEHEGHVNSEFRVKFLTWLSLKATMQERKVVSVFVDTLIDDPSSLSEQLIDTFTDEICREQKQVPQRGLCTKFWH